MDLLAPADPGVLPDLEVDEDDILAILYTSGTTGKPKGATITHRQALANLMNLALGAAASAAMGKGEQRTEHQSAALLIVPLFHVTGTCSTMIVAYASGSKLVLMPPGRFDPDHAMATIEREKVSSIGGVPTVMWRIVEADNFGDYDLSLGDPDRLRRRARRAGAGGADQGRVPAGALVAVDGVRAHRVGVGRHRDLGRRLLRPPRLRRPAGPHRRGDGHRRRRQPAAAEHHR